MPVLLCTLGTSWAVVPEAFLLGSTPLAYHRVLVLTSSGTVASVDRCLEWFKKNQPSVHLTVLRVENLDDLATAEDHHRFEEALYRCYFSLLEESAPEDIHVCLAGGFKTMSAAAQEAAGILGCGNLFHLTIPFGVRTETDEDLEKQIAEKVVRKITLGSRSGWPTMRELASEAPAIPSDSGKISITETRLRDAIYNRLEAANRLSASEHELATLPFPQIARWSPGQRDWLEKPLDPETDAEWMLALPKIDLHSHFGGFASSGELLRQVRAAAENPQNLPPIDPACTPPPGWPLSALDGPPEKRLSAYMKLGDQTGSALLKDPGCLAEHCRLLHAHLVAQNITYAEIRCSPANYATEQRSPWDVLSAIKRHLDEATAKQPSCRVNLIIIATRKEVGDFRTAIGRHLALAVTAAEHWTKDSESRVVGVDLAGYEDISTRAHYFRDDFRAIHRCGLALTVHAGENDDAEGIWSAVFDLNARRLGHALSLRDSPDLLRSVVDRRIGIEMCPYANFQIKGFWRGLGSDENPGVVSSHPTRALPTYPLLSYLEAGAAVTVNTDNIGISGASLTDNFLLLPSLCPKITRLQILHLLRNAVDQCFLSSREKVELLAKLHIPHFIS
ncbi:MAG: CRISPR-associated ring nuclease [Verrucomicrobiota bacterium]